jgi:hypothetical protein
MTLTMKQGSTEIKGELARTINGSRESAGVSGNARPDGSISLTFLISTFNGMPNYEGPYTYNLSSAGGQVTLNGLDPYAQNTRISLARVGPQSAAKISVATYSYAFAPKARVMAVNGSDQASIGKIVVTGVDSLLLTTDTVATAKFRCQLDLNEIGQVITQSERPEKVGEVQFGKQPDGVWVITAINM